MKYINSFGIIFTSIKTICQFEPSFCQFEPIFCQFEPSFCQFEPSFFCQFKPSFCQFELSFCFKSKISWDVSSSMYNPMKYLPCNHNILTKYAKAEGRWGLIRRWACLYLFNYFKKWISII